MCQTDVGKHDAASSVLSSAATYEESLRATIADMSTPSAGERTDDTEARNQLKRRAEQAAVLYFSCRMEAVRLLGVFCSDLNTDQVL